jgi:predicted metalloprotease with PDZ domain
MRLLFVTCLVSLAACQPHPLQERSLLAAGGEELVGEPGGDALAAIKPMSGPTGEGQATIRRGALWYSITVKPDALEISARLLRPASRTSFFLPGPWAGRDDYADNIRILGAWGEGGSRALTLERAQGRLDVEAQQGDPWIELRYEVKLHQRTSVQQRFTPQRLGQGFFAYAPTFLILPSERIAQTLRDIPVEVRTTLASAPVSTWPLLQSAPSKVDASVRVHGFMAQDIHHLRDAYLTLSDELVEQPGAGARVIFERSYLGPKAPLADAIRLVLTRYQERYGALGALTVVVRSPVGERHRWGTGRRGGFVLELDQRAALDHDTLLLVAHESFHMWNGHLLIPTAAEEEQTRWFKEGLTHYIALRTLGELGLSGERALLNEVATAARRYMTHPMTLQGVEAGTPEQRALYPYDRGLLLAMSLDDALRRPNQQACSLDTWFDRTLALSRQRGGYYDSGLLKQALDELPCDTTLARARWQQHVIEGRALALGSLFTDVGLHWLDAEGSRPAKLIPLDGQPAYYARMLALPTAPR